MKIYYVTGNELKVKLAKSIFEIHGVEVVQENLDTPEIQSLDCEPGINPISFISKSYGSISTEVKEGRGYDYDKIFIPENDNRTFSEMSEEEQIAFFNQDAYLKLLDYLNKQKKTN